jgi:hypothetical protein
MKEQIYEEYAVLNAQIKTLENQKDELRVQILQDMVERDLQSANTSVGKFTITKLKTWTYTPAVAQIIEDLKEVKAIEESTGEATYVEKPSLRFTEVKF